MTEKNKRALLIAAIIASLVPLYFVIPYPSLSTFSSLTLYASALAGYSGIVMLLWMFVLGTRATSALLFHDTAPILKVHGWLGKYGSIFILLHPLLVMYSYGESLLYTVVPQIGTLFERHVTLGRISFLLVVGVWITSALIRGKIGYRPWKYIHYLAYISLPFALLHVPDVGSSYMSHIAVKIYYAALVFVTLIFAILRLRSMLNLDRATYRISTQTQLSDDTYFLRLMPDDTTLRPRRGQYINVKLGLVSEDHPFSVVQYDDASGEITLAYRVFGTFTDSLSAKQPGDAVYLSGPYGEFTSEVPATTTPVVYIAGGIGVTPFIDHILRDESGREQWLFYAAATENHATFLPQLREELGDRCIPILSRQTDHTTGWFEAGRIDADKITKHLPQSPESYTYFMCGPDGMMETSYQALRTLGVPKAAIYRESFSF